MENIWVQLCILLNWKIASISPSLSHFEALKPEKEPPDIFSGQYPLKMVGLNGQWSSKKQCCPIWGLNKNVSIFLILFSSSVHWNKRKEFVKFQRHVHFSGPCDFYKKKTFHPIRGMACPGSTLYCSYCSVKLALVPC